MITGTGALFELVDAAAQGVDVSIPVLGGARAAVFEPLAALRLASAVVSDYPQVTAQILGYPLNAEPQDGDGDGDGLIIVVWAESPDLRLRYRVGPGGELLERLCSAAGCEEPRAESRLHHPVCLRHLDHGTLNGLLAREPDMSDDEWDHYRGGRVAAARLRALYEEFTDQRARGRRNIAALFAFALDHGMTFDQALDAMLGPHADPAQRAGLGAEFAQLDRG